MGNKAEENKKDPELGTLAVNTTDVSADTSVVSRLDQALADREVKHGRTEGCLTPGEVSMLD